MEKFSKEQRSNIMRAIRSKNTKPEIHLAKALWHLGYRYRKNNKTVFGKPDFTFKKLKIAIFIDSEFFHGKDWETRKKPQTNAEFWIKKIERNMQRDVEVNVYLESQNWKVLRFWSEDIEKQLQDCVATIEEAIRLRQNGK